MLLDYSLPHYCCSSMTSIWKFAQILGISSGWNHSVVWLLRLYAHARWLSFQCDTHIRHFTSLKWCRCTYGWVLITTLMLKSAKLLEVYSNSGYIKRGKPHHNVAVEAIHPFKMALTPTWPTYKAFNKLHMLWMCKWTSPYSLTGALIGQAFGS